jgi:hypothetical protein
MADEQEKKERQPYATVDDVNKIWQDLSPEQISRATVLLPIISDDLRQEALNRHIDLDKQIKKGLLMLSVVKGVVVDIFTRVITQSNVQPGATPMGNIASGSDIVYMSAGGGTFIKNAELRRLGILRQEIKYIKIGLE